MKTVGVILARLQPIHNGHLALIQKSINENDETYVFVGSADKFNERNPLPISLRLSLAKSALIEKFNWNESTNTIVYQTGPEEIDVRSKRLYIVPLDDLTDENDNSHDWGFYLYSKIVTYTQCSNFTIYYSDGFEIITTWFPGFILRNNISLSLLARNATVSGISATTIRNAIVTGDEDTLKKFVPTGVFELRETIKQHIELSKLIK